MDNRTQVECKELIILKNKLLSLAKMANEYSDNVKALKVLLKLVKMEGKGLKKCKSPIATGDLNALIWAYADFAEIVKKLSSSKKPEVVGKASADLESLIRKTEDEIADLEEKTAPSAAESFKKISSVIENTAQALSKKIGAGAQKISGVVTDALGGKVSDAINGKVEEIKKMIAGDDEN